MQNKTDEIAFHDHKRKIERALQHMLSDDEIANYAEHFNLLSDPTRLKIILALRAGEICVCALSELLSMTDSAISHQLRILRNLKVVTFRKCGRLVCYRLVEDCLFNRILQILDQV